MQSIFGAFYSVIFISYLILSAFIVFHLIRYSVNKSVALFTLIFFIVGTAILLFANATLFLSIPFGQLNNPSSHPTFTLPFDTPSDIRNNKTFGLPQRL